eukprot:365378-Chlamydomonas_euryale.AAC.2
MAASASAALAGWLGPASPPFARRAAGGALSIGRSAVSSAVTSASCASCEPTWCPFGSGSSSR